MLNVESRLATLPQVNIPRTKIKMTPHRHLTTMNAGQLVPIFIQECLPGSTYKVTTRQLVRMSTPIHPVMDNCYMDTYFFFVPNRLCWSHWEEFMGENKRGYWTNDMPTFTIPQLSFDRTAEKGSVADYMGIPTHASGFSVSKLPFNAYALIWNEWFRDQNTQNPAYIGETYSIYSPLSVDPLNGAARGGALLPVSKFHDYFTTSLREPQRGPDVSLPLGNTAPVVTAVNDNEIYSAGSPVGNLNPLRWRSFFNTNTDGFYNVVVNTSGDGIFQNTLNGLVNTTGNDSSPIVPSNLVTDLSSATAATINELRLAFALQTFYEASARYGSRYTELLRGHFGVVSPDSRLQRPEYIGGSRCRLNIQQVLQASSTNNVSPLGTTGAFSLTVDEDESFTYSTVEHGLIIGVCCIRTQQTYQYGIERMWSRKDMIDFYFPEFAHIGEQPVLNKEIYAQGNDVDDQVFGYQEAWAEYRQKFSRVSGAYRSNYAQTLDSWHYAEKYESLPTLSSEFMVQSTDVIDRTLAVSSEVEDQFLCDFRFDMTAVLPMPLESIPGIGTRY